MTALLKHPLRALRLTWLRLTWPAARYEIRKQGGLVGFMRHEQQMNKLLATKPHGMDYT
jgi:hypothetical protein